MNQPFVPPARERAPRGFGFKMPDFFTRSAKEPKEYGDRGSKPAMDEQQAIQASRRAVGIIAMRTNRRPDVKAGRRANLLRLYRERH